MVCSLWGIGLLQAGGAEATPANRVSQKAHCPPVKKEDDPSSLEICYHDFSGSRHKFTCPLNAAPHEEEESFGLYLDHEKIFNELDRRLAEEILKRIQTVGEPLVGYADVEITHNGEASKTPSDTVLWSYKPPRLWKRELPGALRQTTKAIEDQIPKLADEIYQGYVHERGFAFKPSASQGQDKRELEIAYKSIADKERAMLADCYTLFVREAAPEDDAAIVNLLLAALQEMPLLNDDYPPVEEEGRYIDGFWVPLKVLKSRYGDCDSKSVAFCSLWQSPGPQIVLFVNDIPEKEKDRLPPRLRTDKHALLGIEAIPGKKQAFEEIGNRKFVLCEVVAMLGPDMEKLHQGKTLFSFLRRQKYCMTSDCGFEP